MRCLAGLVAASLALGCATFERTTQEWPAVVAERWSEMRAGEGPGMETVIRLVEFHTPTHRLVLRVDDGTYQKLAVGTRVTLLVKVNRKGRAVPGADTLIVFGGTKQREERGTDA